MGEKSHRAADGRRELLLGAVPTVVDLLLEDPVAAVHDDLLVASGHHDALSCPREGVRRAGVRENLPLEVPAALVVEEEPHHGAVCVAGQHPFSRHVAGE